MEFIMSKKLWVGIAVVMSCASVVMASSIVTSEMPAPTGPGNIHVPASGVITAGGVVDNFDGTSRAGTWNFGETAGGTIGTGAFGNPGNGVQADDPGATAGQYGYMYSGNTLGAIAGSVGVALGTPSSYIAFDFNQTTMPSKLELFLTDGAGAAWYTQIDLGANNTWNSYIVWLNPGIETWYSQGTILGTYADDFANIGNYYLGLNILYPDSTPGTYSIDNFEMGQGDYVPPPVPEPGTISMLGFALASMGLTFRRRLRSIFKR
jgi:hypothetical protein